MEYVCVIADSVEDLATSVVGIQDIIYFPDKMSALVNKDEKDLIGRDTSAFCMNTYLLVDGEDYASIYRAEYNISHTHLLIDERTGVIETKTINPKFEEAECFAWLARFAVPEAVLPTKTQVKNLLEMF